MSGAPVTLDDACTHIVDCEHKTAPIDDAGSYYAVGTPAMRGNAINYAEARRINQSTFSDWTRRLRPMRGDLLFAREAPVGPLVRIPDSENVAPGQRTVLLRPNPGVVDSDYLFYLLSSPLQQGRIMAKAAGSTVAHLNVADVRSFELPPLPTVTEQRRVATVLSALDKKIASNATQTDTADALVRALFTREALRTDRSVAVGEIAAQRRDQIDPTAVSPATPYVGLEHIPRRRLWIDQMGAAGGVTSAKSRFLEGDILFGKLRPYFHKVILAPGTGICSTDVLVVAPLDSSLTGFLLAAIASDDVVAACTASSDGTRMPRTNWRDLAAIQIPWPGEQPARSIAASVDALSAAALCAAAENRALAALRDALLPALLSGELRVDAADKALEGVV